MKFKLFIVCLLLSPLSLFGQESPYPEPYRSIHVLPNDPQGWYSNVSQIEEIFNINSIYTVIEVGSWLGQSTCHLANLVPDGGKVYAVDHWLGSSEHQPGQFGWHPAMNHLFQQFLSNVIHAGLTETIIPIRMESLEASRALSIKADLIYIDAGHETAEVYQDLKAWYPKLSEGGILCGDDWGWNTVRDAVIIFAKEKRLKIEYSGNFWRLRKNHQGLISFLSSVLQ